MIDYHVCMADYSWVPEELEGRFSHVNGKLVALCEVCGATKGTPGRGYVLREIAKGNIDRYRFCSIHGDFGYAKPSQEDISSWPKGHKRCRRCLEVKPFEDFHKHKQALFGYSVECKNCRKPSSKAGWRARTFEQSLLASSKFRAKKYDIPHTLTLQDIVIPEVCPVLGVPLVLERGHNYAPSIDQKVPRAGYTQENIVIMSRRANLLKNNMTVDESRLLYEYLSAR